MRDVVEEYSAEGEHFEILDRGHAADIKPVRLFLKCPGNERQKTAGAVLQFTHDSQVLDDFLRGLLRTEYDICAAGKPLFVAGLP